VSLALTGLSGFTTLLGPVESAEAAPAALFNPGNLITDAAFYNADEMSAAGVQSFLESQVPTCAAGGTCLKDYRESTYTRAPDIYCSGQYTGVASQRASDIIKSVALACGVNPRVLLVLLQKEQSLVTSTNPSAAKYQRATGYACPDSGTCAPSTLGFYNQVYKAAWQFRVYRYNPGKWNHKPGQVNNIRFHPNTACGTMAVYIENQATAGLYNYTPYTPNPAALGNMYGTGDGCSSYGNRNFWRIYTDWFGNPNGGGSLVKSASNSSVFLVTNSVKYLVSSPTVHQSLLSALGPVYTSSQPYLDAIPTSPTNASNLLRGPDGWIFLSAYGSKNRFNDCAMVIEYGFAPPCGPYIDVNLPQIQKFTTGAQITQFAQSATSGVVYYVNDGKKRGIQTQAQFVALAAGGSMTTVTMPQATLDLIPSGPDYLVPATVVKTAASSQLYLAGLDGELIKMSANLQAGFGLGAPRTIDAGALAASTVREASLTSAVTCGSATYIAGGGKSWSVPNAAGLPTTALDTATCTALPKSAQAVTGPVFLISPTGIAYLISGGQRQTMANLAQVDALNGTNPRVLIPATQATIDSIPIGYAAGTVGKSPTTGIVYLLNGTVSKIRMTSALTADLGLGILPVPDAVLNTYPTAPGMLTMTVTCGSATYIAGGGKSWSVPNAAGLPTTALDTATCTALPKSAQAVTGPVFLISPTGVAYLISGGQRQTMANLAQVDALNGTNPRVLIPATQATIDSIPIG
jgi:hypothetical protein